MKVQFELVIGENKFTLIEDVESNTDFFKKLHFYSTLPKVGPNGETDLQLRFRIAQKQYEYYSIVSEKAGMEFKFGQPKEGKGVLFPKGWEPIYKAEDDADSETTTPTSGLGAPVSATQTAPKTQASGLGTPTPAPAPATTLTPPPAAQPTPAPAVTPQVQNQAAAILAKFGI